MKRLILLATMMVAVLASCEKHEIRNEVLTEIGFESNVGKQTRAIVDGTVYPESQPFAVLAYSHQGNTITNVMNNVEVTKPQGENDWKASGTTKYYWPNDASTTMNFYAYSPAIYTTVPNGIKNHQKLNGTIVVDNNGNTNEIEDPNGIYIKGYTHKNMYVDFMVADYVTGATFADQDGNLTNATPNLVPAKFKHQMTQIIFKVKTDITYDGVTFTLNNITLNNIKNTGDINNGAFDNGTSGAVSYEIFPAKVETAENGAPGLLGNQTTYTITNTESEVSNIIPVTMIPQAFNQNQSFTINYSISGTGVATETVTKTISFADTPAWESNKKITYVLTIGLNDIKFSPSVTTWVEYDHDPNTDGTQNYPIEIQ